MSDKTTALALLLRRLFPRRKPDAYERIGTQMGQSFVRAMQQVSADMRAEREQRAAIEKELSNG